MRIQFSLPERIIGVLGANVNPGEMATVITSESLTSFDGATLTWRLESMHGAIFGHIPGLPPPSVIDHILVVIQPTLSATAYVNELRPTAMVQAARAIGKGEAVFGADVADMLSFDPGVDIPADCGFVLVRSLGWRRAIFFDLSPLAPTSGPRTFDIKTILAKQTLALLKGSFDQTLAGQDKLSKLKQGIDVLNELIATHNEDEAKYQELFMQYPWFFGGQHTSIERHLSLDDENIPDYTGVRAHDGFRDVFEIKQPFMPCFRKAGKFTQAFNDAWSQAGRYLTFVRNNDDYLRRQKGLGFVNPRCFVVLGHGFSTIQLKRLQSHEALTPGIILLTYEHVLSLGSSFLKLLSEAAKAPPTC